MQEWMELLGLTSGADCTLADLAMLSQGLDRATG